MTHVERTMRRQQVTAFVREHGVLAAANQFDMSVMYVSALSGVRPKKLRARGQLQFSTYMIIAALQNRNGATLKSLGERFNMTRQGIDSVKSLCRKAGVVGV